MDRRKFIGQLGLITGITILPIEAITKTIFDSTFEPYFFKVNDPVFAERLSYGSLPDVTRGSSLEIDGLQYTDNKKIWISGEGKNNLIDNEIQYKNGAGNYGYTPVTRLVGFYGGHEVYGQWLKGTNGNLTGKIKGWDGKIYLVFHDFRNIFTSQYRCYGLPSSDYMVKTCGICGLGYVIQTFKTSCDSKEIVVYNSTVGHCPNRFGGYKFHDNLNLKEIPKCSIEDKIFESD
jgi:hypothetical protein